MEPRSSHGWFTPSDLSPAGIKCQPAQFSGVHPPHRTALLQSIRILFQRFHFFQVAALTVCFGVWPVSLLAPWLLNPTIAHLSLPLQALLVAVGIVILFTWAVMPLPATVLGPWLQHRPLRRKELIK